MHTSFHARFNCTPYKYTKSNIYFHFESSKPIYTQSLSWELIPRYNGLSLVSVEIAEPVKNKKTSKYKIFFLYWLKIKLKMAKI